MICPWQNEITLKGSQGVVFLNGHQTRNIIKLHNWVMPALTSQGDFSMSPPHLVNLTLDNTKPCCPRCNGLSHPSHSSPTQPVSVFCGPNFKQSLNMTTWCPKTMTWISSIIGHRFTRFYNPYLWWRYENNKRRLQVNKAPTSISTFISRNNTDQVYPPR